MNATLFLPEYGVKIDDPCCYPLGAMYVTSFLKRLGFKVKVLNFNLFDYDLREELKGQDALYFTGADEFLPAIRAASGMAKERGIKTIIGGVLATFDPESVRPYCDAVVQGEIEKNIHIDNISWPDYEGFGVDEYHRRHAIRYMGILASRGCPFACTFCAHVCKYRERTLDLVADEIDHYIKTYHIEYLVFYDNTLNVRKPRFLEVCRMMRPRKIAWSAAIRADKFDDEMAVAAKDSGCQYFVIGVESFRQDRLDRMNKRLKVEQLKRTLDILHKHNLNYHGNIILGLEDETVEDIAGEVRDLPLGYNLYPVLMQPFCGVKAGSSLTQGQRDHLNHIFTEYATERGMEVLPVCCRN